MNGNTRTTDRNIFFKTSNLGISTGYTLVEVVVAIMIMLTVFSVATARLRDFQRRKTLEIAYEQVKKDIRFAQEMAFAGRIPAEPPGNSCESFPLEGYAFTREATYNASTQVPAQYAIYAMCRNWGQKVLVKGPVALPLEADIGAFGSGNRFVFNILGRGTDRDADIVIPIIYNGITKNITITHAGNVE